MILIDFVLINRVVLPLGAMIIKKREWKLSWIPWIVFPFFLSSSRMLWWSMELQLESWSLLLITEKRTMGTR